MNAKFRKIGVYLIWLAIIPLILGMVGYAQVEDMSWGERFYAAAALYWVNPVSDDVNIWIIIAEITGAMVSASVILNLVFAVFREFGQLLIRFTRDSKAVYSDNDWGHDLAKRLKHGYHCDDPLCEQVERTKNHIFMYTDDMTNMNLYTIHKKALKGSNVYILLQNTDPYLLGATNEKEISVHFFNIYELMARHYWKQNSFYENRHKPVIKVAIVGFGKVGEGIFKYGYMNNIYSLNQRFEYHIWGCSGTDAEFYQSLSFVNEDAVFIHENEAIQDAKLMVDMDRIILTENTQSELLQALLHLNATMPIHCYYPFPLRLMDFYAAENVKSVGCIENYLTEDTVINERLDQQAKYFNYDYSLRYSNTVAPADYKKRAEEAWRDLDGFKKGSNVARADHYWIEKKLREDEPDIPEETYWRIEHIRWCRFHFINHWSYAPVRNNQMRHHPLLVPFDQLSREEQEKDGIYDSTLRKAIEELLD